MLFCRSEPTRWAAYLIPLGHSCTLTARSPGGHLLAWGDRPRVDSWHRSAGPLIGFARNGWLERASSGSGEASSRSFFETLFLNPPLPMSSLRLPASVLLTTALFFVLSSPPACAQEPNGSPLPTNLPDRWKTKVFVLGSTHLSGVADQFEPSALDSLITALDAFGPTAIAVERLPGRQVAAMERWGGRLDEVNRRFAGTMLYHGRRIRKQTGWSWSQANRRADSLLTRARTDARALSSERRLALIRSLVAAYRLPSAALQWKYLSPEERSSQQVLPDTTAEDLNKRLGAASETYSIGMRLAHRRGHQRLYPMDYQAEHDLMVEIDSLYKKVMSSLRKELMSHPIVIEHTDSLEQAGLKSGSLLTLYRHLNGGRWARERIDVHWGELLRRRAPENVGHARAALFETRNLHMAGQIQRTVAQHPGERVLVVVGTSHKPHFDAYLQQMMGVKVVEAEEVIPGL